MNKKIKIGMAFIAASFGLFSCGGSSNNDQGVAFVLVGMNSVDDDGLCEKDKFTDGILVPISGGTDGSFTGAGTCLQVQNNLSTQGIRADRVLLNFYIPGSDLQPDSTNAPVGLALGPAEGSTNAPNSSLPPGYRNIGNVGSVTLEALPTAVREFLNLNRNSLPELPYAVQVEATVSGVTTAGDRVNTNPVGFQVFLTVADTVIPGTTGETGAAGVTTEEAQTIDPVNTGTTDPITEEGASF